MMSELQSVPKPSSRAIDPAINLLKLIAIVTMTIDHVGHFIFPTEAWFRLAGRLAAPIFTYLIVIGLKNTANLRKYVFRLAILAVVSQVVFFFTTNNTSPNIIFNFLGVIAMIKGPVWLKIALIPLYALLNVELGWLILAIGATYYYCRRIRLQPFLVLAAVMLYCFNGIWLSNAPVFYTIQLASGVAGFVVMVVNSMTDWLQNSKFLMRRWPKYLFYVYYPLNWLVLYLLRLAI